MSELVFSINLSRKGKAHPQQLLSTTSQLQSCLSPLAIESWPILPGPCPPPRPSGPAGPGASVPMAVMGHLQDSVDSIFDDS